MTLYFDLDAGFFVYGPGTRDRIDSLSFKRGDTCRIDVRFVSGITVQELATGATGKIGLKESGQYDADFVAAAASWTKTGTGTSTVYSFDLNLATTELNALLGDDGTEGNDVDSVALMFEMEFVADGVTTSSPTLTATVANDVIKGDESGPTDITSGTPANESILVGGTITPGGSGTAGDFVRSIPDGPYDYLWTTTGVPTVPMGIWWRIGYYGDLEQWVLQQFQDTVLQATWTAATTNLDPTAATFIAGSGATGTPVLTWKGDGTDGFVGTMKVDADYLYVVSEVDTTKPFWKKIALSAL